MARPSRLPPAAARAGDGARAFSRATVQVLLCGQLRAAARFDLAAVKTVCGADFLSDVSAVEMVGPLVDRSMVIAERVGSGTHAALAVLLGLNGLRVSEACSTNIEDLDLQRGHRTLHIIGLLGCVREHEIPNGPGPGRSPM